EVLRAQLVDGGLARSDAREAGFGLLVALPRGFRVAAGFRALRQERRAAGERGERKNESEEPFHLSVTLPGRRDVSDAPVRQGRRSENATAGHTSDFGVISGAARWFLGHAVHGAGLHFTTH